MRVHEAPLCFVPCCWAGGQPGLLCRWLWAVGHRAPAELGLPAFPGGWRRSDPSQGFGAGRAGCWAPAFRGSGVRKLPWSCSGCFGSGEPAGPLGGRGLWWRLSPAPALMVSPPHNSLQTEIAKRLNVICAQLIPFLSQEVGEPPAAPSLGLLLPAPWGAGPAAQCRLAPLSSLPASTSSKWSRPWSVRSR